MTTPSADAGKDAVRAWARDLRTQLDWERLSQDIVAALREWPPLRVARTALVFLPMADEVNLTGLLSAEEGPEYVATRTPAEGPLTIHRLGGPLEVHRFGFLQPHASAPEVDVADVDVFLLPGLAFDLFGTRLGRGAGYFDGLLGAARRGAALVGVVPAPLVVDELPHEPHDVRVSYLATEEGVIGVAD